MTTILESISTNECAPGDVHASRVCQNLARLQCGESVSSPGAYFAGGCFENFFGERP